MNPRMYKYQRTHHLEGSRLQPGDEDLEAAPFAAIRGRHIVCEEKVDGSNCGLSFDATGRLHLQNRGHFLTGGVREKHFHLFKQWANAHAAALWDVLGPRHVVYREWLYARAAGIGHLLRVEKRDVRDFQPPPDSPGVVLCNPPYGERIGEEKELRGLYQLLGEVFSKRCAGWTAYVFTGNPRLAAAIDLKPAGETPLYNGKIPCRLLKFEMG